MDINDLTASLQEFGLTAEEATLYLYLLRVKSASIRDIYSSQEFKAKRRPNLYKLVANLAKKHVITEEVKERRKIFFAEPPFEVLQGVITDQIAFLEHLQQVVPVLGDALEQIFVKPTVDLGSLPPTWRTFIESAVDPKWFLKERPVVREERGLGTIYSVEYNTLRRFGANSAGIAIHEFRYPEHREKVLPRIQAYVRQSMEAALQNINDGKVRVKGYSFSDKVLTTKPWQEILPYTETRVRLNFPGTHRGGLTTLVLKEFPSAAFSIWGAHFRDFQVILRRISQKYLPETAPSLNTG